MIRTVRYVIRYGCSVIGALLLLIQGLYSQPWEHVRTVQLGSVPANATVALAMDGDILAVSVSSDGGGTTRVLTRHQGGLDQWGVIRSIEEADPWSAYSLALRNGMLAVGSPGAASAGPFTGVVRMFRIVPADLIDPVQTSGSIVLPDAVGNDRFGYALAWIGDTLLASAVGRSSFHTTGAVFLCADGPQGFQAIGALPIASNDVQVPFTRWFGRSIAVARDRIAIAAPYSGFDVGYAEQNVGAVHLFKPDLVSGIGWVLDTAWFDAGLDAADPCRFERIELGKEGLAFVGDELIMDHSRRHIGVPGTLLEHWQSHDPAPIGCPECGLRIVQHEASDWDFDGSTSPLASSPLLQRGVRGWCVDGDTLYVEWFDPTAVTWHTDRHVRDAGGPGAWGVVDEIPELDACDDLRGPMIVNGDHLVRTSLRRGSECGVEDGSMAIDLQIFHR